MISLPGLTTGYPIVGTEPGRCCGGHMADYQRHRRNVAPSHDPPRPDRRVGNACDSLHLARRPIQFSAVGG